MITLRQLQYLLSLEKQRSFSKAADACFVTQSTLSAGIKQMETALGFAVAERGAGTVQLTPAGALLAEKGDEILGDVESMIAVARQMQAPMTGPLRLGVIPTIAPYMLPRVLPAVAEQYPDLDLSITEDLTDRLIDKLHAREIDVALMAFPWPVPGLEKNILFDDYFYHVQPIEKPLSRNAKNKNILLLEDGHCLRDHIIEACHIYNAQKGEHKRVKFTSLTTILHMVAAGMGETILPAMACAKSHIPPQIIISQQPVIEEGVMAKRQVGFAWRKGYTIEKTITSLSDLILQQWSAKRA